MCFVIMYEVPSSLQDYLSRNRELPVLNLYRLLGSILGPFLGLPTLGASELLARSDESRIKNRWRDGDLVNSPVETWCTNMTQVTYTRTSG